MEFHDIRPSKQANLRLTGADNSSSSPLYFPATKIAYVLGWGFDPINGDVIKNSPFDDPLSKSDKIKTPFNHRVFDTISDVASFEATTDYVESAVGKGPCTTVKQKTECSASLQSNSQVLNVVFNASYIVEQNMLDPATVPLSKNALNCLIKEGYEAFTNSYGTHCILGMTMGHTCYMSYKYIFNSTSAQASYSEKFKEKVDLGVGSESTSEDMEAELSVSNQYVDESKTSGGSFRSLNYSFDGLDSMIKIADEFSTFDPVASGGPVANPVTLFVVPYTYFDCVMNAVNKSGLSKSNLRITDDNILGEQTRKLHYIGQTVHDFLTGGKTGLGKYAGKSQYDSVKKLDGLLQKKNDEISQFLKDANNGEIEITSATVNAIAKDDNGDFYSTIYGEAWADCGNQFFLSFSGHNQTGGLSSSLQDPTGITFQEALSTDKNQWCIGSDPKGLKMSWHPESDYLEGHVKTIGDDYIDFTLFEGLESRDIIPASPETWIKKQEEGGVRIFPATGEIQAYLTNTTTSFDSSKFPFPPPVSTTTRENGAKIVFMGTRYDHSDVDSDIPPGQSSFSCKSLKPVTLPYCKISVQ